MSILRLSEFTLPANDQQILEETLNALVSWRAFIICIDGRSGLGKSVYARYLAYRLEMPCYHLDEFKTGRGIFSHSDDFVGRIKLRRDKDRPVIAEGLCAAQVLSELGCKCDWLIRLEMKDFVGPECFKEDCDRYESKFKPNIYAKARTPPSEFDESWIDSKQSS